MDDQEDITELYYTKKKANMHMWLRICYSISNQKCQAEEWWPCVT